MNQIASYSGGKDSQAGVLMMLERNEPLRSVLFCDTGWEFPEMLDNIDKFEKYIGIKIVRVKPKHDFTYSLFDRKIIPHKKGNAVRYGNGWPSPMRRWCTREKVYAMDRYINTIPDPLVCIFFAYDELSRLHSAESKRKKYQIRYPLVEYQVTEAEALEYCYQKGFDWNGLYAKFKRVSCFCCPMQRLRELRNLRKYYPELWNQMLEWDARKPEHNPGFKGYKTVHDLEKRFEREDRQGNLFLTLEAQE